MLALLATVFIQGCSASRANGAKADCRGLSGSYRDAADPNGDSLIYFLLNKKSPQGHLVRLDVSGQALRVSSGAAAGSLTARKASLIAVLATSCWPARRLRTSACPLIDQTNTITYVLTGGAGAGLVLTS